MNNTNCNFCEYLSKRAGTGNYFIYICKHWGITSQGILPQSVIINTIGKKCPFFKKNNNIKKTKEKTNISEKKDDNLDIII
jgi:hypothetical protein